MADSTFQNGMTPGGTDKNGMAVASLVLGIIAVCCCCVSGLSLVLGILAIVFSILSRKNPAKWIGNSWFGFGNHCICFGNYFNYRCTNRLVSDNGNTAVD